MAHLTHYKRAGVAAMVGHYNREAERKGYHRDNIDPSRTAQNFAIGAASPDALAAAVRARVDQAVAQHEESTGKRIRKDANVLSDWVVTLPKDCPREYAPAFFQICVTAVQARYGKENVPGGFVHMDEMTPHVHIPVIPVKDGRLRASKVFTRADLQGFHSYIGKACDTILGFHVSVELDPADAGTKQLSHLKQKDYKLAKDELRDAQEKALRATEKAAEARKAQTVAENAQKASEERRRAENAAEARAVAQRRKAEEDAAQAREDAAVAQADAAAWQSIVADVQGVSYVDAEGHERMGIKGMEQAYTAAQDRLKGIQEQERTAIEQRDKARSEAQEWQAKAAAAQKAAGVTPDRLRMALSVTVISIAEACIMAYDRARELARDMWHIWMNWHMPTIAQDMGIDAEEGREISEGALLETCEYNHREEVADYLLEGGQEHEQDFYQDR